MPPPVAAKSPESHAVVSVEFRQGVTFTTRGTFIRITVAPAKNPGLSGDSGGFEVKASPVGLSIADPKAKTAFLVPWSNVASVQVEAE